MERWLSAITPDLGGTERHECTEPQLKALAASDSGLYLSVQAFNIFLCIVTSLLIPVNVYKLQSFPRTKIPLKLKAWFIFYFLDEYLYLFSYISIEYYHFMSRFLKHGCDLLVPASTCLKYRIVQSFRTVFCHYYQNALLIDFYLAYVFRWCRKLPISSFFLAALLVSGSIYHVFPSVQVELNSTQMLVNCASFESKSNAALIRYIYAPLAVADGIGLIFHIAWFIFQYQRTRKSTYKWNKKYEKAFKAANLTFKIQLPLFLLNLFSNTWKDIFNIWFALDDKISATIFMYTNTTPLCMLLTQLLLLFIWDVINNVKRYRQYQADFKKKQWCCVRSKKPSAVGTQSEPPQQPKRLFIRTHPPINPAAKLDN